MFFAGGPGGETLGGPGRGTTANMLSTVRSEASLALREHRLCAAFEIRSWASRPALRDLSGVAPDSAPLPPLAPQHGHIRSSTACSPQEAGWGC